MCKKRNRVILFFVNFALPMATDSYGSVQLSGVPLSASSGDYVTACEVPADGLSLVHSVGLLKRKNIVATSIGSSITSVLVPRKQRAEALQALLDDSIRYPHIYLSIGHKQLKGVALNMKLISVNRPFIEASVMLKSLKLPLIASALDTIRERILSVRPKTVGLLVENVEFESRPYVNLNADSKLGYYVSAHVRCSEGMIFWKVSVYDGGVGIRDMGGSFSK